MTATPFWFQRRNLQPRRIEGANSKAPGTVSDSRCDTEVVLRAFLEWDVDAFPRLRGMFAAALWFQSQRRLVWCGTGWGSSRSITPAAAGPVFRLGDEGHPAASRDRSHHEQRRARPLPLGQLRIRLAIPLVEGIEKLAPGHWLEWRDGRISDHVYWQLEFRPDPRLDLSPPRASSTACCVPRCEH